MSNMRSIFYAAASVLFFGCSTPEAPKGSPVTGEAPLTTEAPARPAVPKDKWKVKSAEEAKVFLQSCEPVKEGSLLLTVEQEATPEFPLWWIGLQIKDGPLLD